MNDLSLDTRKDVSFKGRRNNRRRFFSNNVDPYIPELWSIGSLDILYENMVAAALVNRDFEPTFQKFGDIVNTRRPAEFTAKRKEKTDSVTRQDATATNVQVPLNQHVHVNFGFEDVDRTWSMKDLMKEFIEPAGMALARYVDQMVVYQYTGFLDNSAGLLNGITSANIKDKVIDLRQVMDDNKAPEIGRNVILTTKTDADMLRPEWFTSADKRGDTEGLRNASIGEKFNFRFWKDQNAANIAVGNTLSSIGGDNAFLINNATGYAKGYAGSITVDTGTGNIAVGMWVQIGGFPYQVTAHTGTAPTTAITLNTALKTSVANNDPFDVYLPGAVNLVAGYVAGWQKEIVVDTFTVAPKRGQLVTFGTSTVRYAVMAATTTSLLLDRPLDVAIANDDAINLGPAGAYNLAFCRDAMTLAIRPLAMIPEQTGARMGLSSWNKLTVRSTVYYDGDAQCLKITLDFLAGIKILDTNQGAVLLG